VGDTPVPSVPVAAPVVATAGAKGLNGLVIRSTSAPVVVAVPTTNVATPVITSQATPQTAVPAAVRVEGAWLGRGIAFEEERNELFAPPAMEGDSQPGTTPVTPPVTTPADSTEAFTQPAVESEARAALPSSASAVAEAAADDWTPDGALAAASVLFAGTWLRRDAGHPRDEERPHHRPARRKQDVP
jgi:hypothetical protein